LHYISEGTLLEGLAGSVAGLGVEQRALVRVRRQRQHGVVQIAVPVLLEVEQMQHRSVGKVELLVEEGAHPREQLVLDVEVGGLRGRELLGVARDLDHVARAVLARLQLGHLPEWDSNVRPSADCSDGGHKDPGSSSAKGRGLESASRTFRR
jgi:hypothetical protein